MKKVFLLFILFISIDSFYSLTGDTLKCIAINEYLPVGGVCCEGLIPQKEGDFVKCVVERSWFNWRDFFLGLAIPFLVFAYIAIFVKRKQKSKS